MGTEIEATRQAQWLSAQHGCTGYVYEQVSCGSYGVRFGPFRDDDRDRDAFRFVSAWRGLERVLYRCTNYPNGGRDRCANAAVGLLCAPDGETIPAPHTCQACADAVVSEYRVKLGEVWTLRALPGA